MGAVLVALAALVLACCGPRLHLLHPAEASLSSWFSGGSGSTKEEEKGGGAPANNADESDSDVLDKGNLVSPIVDRELEASVAARDWPTTTQSAFCEAYAFHVAVDSDDDSDVGDDGDDNVGNAGSASTATAFLRNLAEKFGDEGGRKQPPSTYREAIDLVLEASPLDDVSLLELSLAMRAGSPSCELQRGLARDALLRNGMCGGEGGDGDVEFDVLAVVYPTGKVLLQDEVLSEGFVGMLEQVLAQGGEDADVDAHLLPGEVPSGGGGKGPLIALHANLGTPAFAAAYRRLLDANIKFVVRHLGAVDHEEKSSATTSTGTVLQGYGVRLDIRNVEYKVRAACKEGRGIIVSVREKCP